MTAGRSTNTKSKHWNTPLHIVESARKVFDSEIDLDPCSNKYSIVDATVKYQLPEHDGLAESWNYDTIFVNPPYGFDKERKTRISHWFEKAAESAQNGSQVIMLVPVATNTGHWKQYVYPIASAICFLYDTRFRFWINGVEEQNGAPMAVSVIYYGNDVQRFGTEFQQYGAVLPLDNAMLPSV